MDITKMKIKHTCTLYQLEELSCKIFLKPPGIGESRRILYLIPLVKWPPLPPTLYGTLKKFKQTIYKSTI